LLTSGVQFNTVEGLNLSMNGTYAKEFEDYRNFSIHGGVRYGFANYLWGGKLGFYYLQKPEKFQRFNFTFQSIVQQFNSNNPISESMNSLYSIYAKDNYMKLYRKTSAQVYFRRELINGIYLSSNIEYAIRDPLRNHSDFAFHYANGRTYTSNDAQHPKTDDSAFKSNNALVLDVYLTFKIKQKYYTVPHRKIISGSKYPAMSLRYRKAIPGLNTYANYDLISAYVEDDIHLGLVGTFSYRLNAGYFLNNRAMSFMDYKHFNGNQTLLANPDYLNSFKLLPYYLYSTNTWYAEAHAEHHFNGFIFNKIPLLKKMKIQEVVGGHLLYTDKVSHYYEVNFGIEKIFQVVRVDYVLGYGPLNKFNQGFLIGLGINF
jgi:hypothetical protein